MIFEAGGFVLTLAHLFILAGGVFIVLEAVAPGADMVVIGAALLLAGLFGVQTGIGTEVVNASNLFYLSIVAFLSGLLVFYFYRKYLHKQGKGVVTSSSDDLKDAQGITITKVTADEGRVRIENGGSNPKYSARSTAGVIEARTKIRVVDPGGGSLLRVAPLENEMEDEAESSSVEASGDDHADGS